MAKAKFGSIVTDVRGKLGGHVFQGNGFTTSLRTGYSGKGGIRHRSDIYKSMNGVIDSLWNDLSSADQNQWRILATLYPIPDNFGNEAFLSAQNLHRRNYTYFFASGQTGVINPYTAISDLPSSNLHYVEFNFSTQEIDVQFAFDRFSQAIIVYALPVSGFNVSFSPDKTPFLYGENDETPQDDLLWDAFFAKYPDFQENDPCHFGVVQVNEFGFSSFKKMIYGNFV